ncbi:MAG: peptidoglycan DD-metalloendopeptidase family protein [Gammaproteobacteria bacterium]|nr:peptidoglycan DD-metalloendopeptidase family protein [Gammaproteobacteria bacterium]
MRKKRLTAARPHHYWLGGALAIVLTISLANVSSQPSAANSVGDFEGDAQIALTLPSNGRIERGTRVPAAEPAVGTNLKRLNLVVKSGDSLAAMFDRHELSRQDLHEIMLLGESVERLRLIRPGDRINVVADSAGNVLEVSMELDGTDKLRIEQGEQGYTTSLEALPLQRRIQTASATIESSMYAAGYAAGLSDTLIMNLANIYGWDIDFALDIRQGDEFRIIYEEIFRDGEKVKDGPIIAAEFVNDGRVIQAVRFVDDNGNAAYYGPDGRAMRKTFLRAPLNFLYVSSNFNPSRLHPVLKTVRPHNGIDYKAPVGTPVFAAGDGRVVRSSYSKYNGHHVFIQHGEKFVTKYLHFTRRAVSVGQRVKQGQVIGYVGSTGLASGPHLHYEFLVNGTHRNPRTVKLPDAEPIAEQYKDQFMAVSTPLLRQLDVIGSDRTRVATAP